MAKGILLVAFDFSTAHEDEFHDWYDLEHIPERQRVPGFGLCERWISVANPKQAVASYDLDSPAVLKSEPYLAIAYENLSPWSKRVGPMCKRLLRFDGAGEAVCLECAGPGARPDDFRPVPREERLALLAEPAVTVGRRARRS